MFTYTVYLKGGASFDYKAEGYEVMPSQFGNKRSELRFFNYHPKTEEKLFHENQFIDANEVAAVIVKKVTRESAKATVFAG